METLHPALVHFAIVLPLVALTFQALYLLKDEMAYSKASLVILVFTAIFVAASYLTGSEDGSEVAEIFSVYSKEGMAELKGHAQLGYYLLIATSIVAAVKVANFFYFKRKVVEIVLAVALVLVSGFMLVQGKEGGEIVYEHGTLFEGHELKDILKESLVDLADSDDQEESLEILKDAIESALKKD